jgi:hypothetical protein
MTNIFPDWYSTIPAIPTIRQGLAFILLLLEGLWPKMASTHLTNNAQIRVNSPEEAIHRYAQAKLLDSKISAYPNYTEEFRKCAHDCKTFGGRGIAPGLIFIDLDHGMFNDNIDLLNKAMFRTLHNINEKFHGKFKPAVIWSGNGYHVYLPVQLSGPSWCLTHTDVFCELSSDPDRRFMQWAEQYLSDGKSDPAHIKSISFKNCMLRIPGSVNSKNGEQVRILQKWDGQRPYINWILKDFQRYLIQKKIRGHQREEQEISRYFSTDWAKAKLKAEVGEKK